MVVRSVVVTSCIYVHAYFVLAPFNGTKKKVVAIVEMKVVGTDQGVALNQLKNKNYKFTMGWSLKGATAEKEIRLQCKNGREKLSCGK